MKIIIFSPQNIFRFSNMADVKTYKKELFALPKFVKYVSMVKNFHV